VLFRSSWGSATIVVNRLIHSSCEYPEFVIRPRLWHEAHCASTTSLPGPSGSETAAPPRPRPRSWPTIEIGAAAIATNSTSPHLTLLDMTTSLVESAATETAGDATPTVAHSRHSRPVP